MDRIRVEMTRRHLLPLLLALPWVLGCGAPAPPAAESPTKPRLLFVGVDGATWKLIGPMIERGELPSFRRLRDEGAHMPEFETISTTFSPVVWTSVATGRAPEDHGITSFTTELPNGERIPVTSNARRARAIWELASRRGVSVGVTGWWASWPAEEVDGYVITDHANPAFSELLVADRTYWTASEQDLARLQRDFYPLDVGPILARHWMGKEDFPYEELAAEGGFTAAQMEALRAAPWNDRAVYPWLKTFYRIDRPLLRASLDLLRERPTDLWMLYLRGPDAVQHYGWDLVEPERFARLRNDLERDRGLVEGVYRYLDRFLGEILAARPPDAWLIVASDHGAEPSHEAMDPGATGRPGEHSTAAKGVLFVLGPGVRQGLRLERGGPYDLMPTMAWLLGLPVAQDLPGRPLQEAFTEEFVRARPLDTVATYGVREVRPLSASPSDQAMLESLRNLGYIE
jgi:predicted AlkP superfamily pyrophosphatase or phosphodiesterase